MKTEVPRIDPKDIDLSKIKIAADVIKSGGIVGFPTETVYGLAADAFNPKAIEKVFAVKKRPQNKPFTVQIKDSAYLEQIARDISTFAYQLIARFWPGPLTLVLHAKEGGTIGVRISSNQIAQKIIEQAQTAIIAPSANLSGEAEAKDAQEVLNVFAGQIDLVIDGGVVDTGVSSTVVDLTVEPYEILREGAITKKDIQSI